MRLSISLVPRAMITLMPVWVLTLSLAMMAMTSLMVVMVPTRSMVVTAMMCSLAVRALTCSMAARAMIYLSSTSSITGRMGIMMTTVIATPRFCQWRSMGTIRSMTMWMMPSQLQRAMEHIMSMSSRVSHITCPMATTLTIMEICQSTMTSMTASVSM